VIAAILAEIERLPPAGHTGPYPIDVARAVIASSGGAVTWATAGETWATLARGVPGTTYPPLR
jgi:hypothetical protein